MYNLLFLTLRRPSSEICSFLLLLSALTLSWDYVTSQQLESNIIPIRYDLQIQLPTSSKKDPLIPAFFGSVKIEFQLSAPLFAQTRRYNFNAFMPQFRPIASQVEGVHLRLLGQKLENFENVTLQSHVNGKTFVISSLRIEQKHVVFGFGESSLPLGRYTLNIERYTGIITYDKGIYYRDAGNHPVLGTDLFPYYAPLVFPCFEDPLMAIFQVALIHPQDTIALSSMQAQASSQNLNENWRLTKFVQSDNLYPYNLFIGVMPSEYEKSRSTSTKFPIHIWTNKHLHPKEVKESMVDLVGRIYDELEEILREPLSVAQLNIVMMNDFNGTHSFGTIAISLEEFIVSDDIHRAAMIARLLVKQWIGGSTTISTMSELCFQEDLAEYVVNKVLESLFHTNSNEYQKYRLASYVRIQISETFFGPGESLTLVNEPDEITIRSHCRLKGPIMLESLEAILGGSMLISKIRKLVSQHEHRSFRLETFLTYLRGHIVDKNISLAQVYEFWQKNGGIPNLYVEKLDESLRLIQMNNGRQAQMGASNWAPMPLWPIHIEARNFSLPITFMISQGLEMAPIDKTALFLTNLGYNNVYRVNYDPVTWQQLASSISNSSSFSPIARAQVINDFCYFYSLGETGQEGNKIRRSFLEYVRTKSEELDLCEFYTFWCTAGNGRQINLATKAKLRYQLLMTKLQRVLSNRKHYACFEAPVNSGGDANAAKVANQLCQLAFGTDCL